MGQHTTIHGKTNESFNGQGGKWTPVRVNSSGQIEMASLAGELAAVNRLAGGAIAKYATIGADTTVVVGPAILYGVVLIAAGTMASIYDNTAASGTVLIPSTTASVNFNGVGILCNNGIFADWTSGTWLVLYADAS
jgi:hypothetical protein